MSDFRMIPSIDALRQRAAVRALEARFGADATIDALRQAASAVRSAIAGGDAMFADEGAVAGQIESAAAARLDGAFRPSLQRVINATGVIIHTNLGRAPIAPAAIDRVVEVARGYSSLEYDLGRGARGRRDRHAEALLCRLTGAEAAVVVNNNAAATMIVLAALAAGREVIVSRGELVEIGGGFRVPDVMAQSGAVLREVGTTNKTRASDYAAAITDRTALILRVHPSNFRIEGFTSRPTLDELVALGRKFKIPVAEDLGSGYLPVGSDGGQTGVRHPSDPRDKFQTGVGRVSDTSPTLSDEPAVPASIEAGVDVCCFSGDKLVGGPQAGIIAGRTPIVDRIRTHPLMRALRVDKMTYAALEGTLAEYAAGRAASTIPVQRMLWMAAGELARRSETLAGAIAKIEGWRAEVVQGASAIGGGSGPGIELPTCLVVIHRDGLTADALSARLRTLSPPIVARIERDRVLLDLRTVLPDEDTALATLLATV
jgi:L-seryl-tRNA(Ser) seleniumtransferase